MTVIYNLSDKTNVQAYSLYGGTLFTYLLALPYIPPPSDMNGM